MSEISPTDKRPPVRLRTRSLRWRLQLWHASILAIVILLFGLLIYLQQRHMTFSVIDDELAAAVEFLSKQFDATEVIVNGAPESNLESDLPIIAELRGTFRSRNFRRPKDAPYFVVTSDDGSILAHNGPIPDIPDTQTTRDRSRLPLQFQNRRSYREVVLVGVTGGSVLVGRDTGPDRVQLRDLSLLLMAVGTAVFLVGLAGGWILTGRAIRPIHDISQIAGEISEQNLSRRIELGETDAEFTELVETLNATFSRLNGAFSRQLAFTADASHELRTPLSVIKMHQELALSQERSSEEYRQTLETCQRATTRMSDLVEALLTLARIDANTDSPRTESVDLLDMARQCADELQPVATSRKVQISVLGESAVIQGASVQLRQLMINLLSNAIAHSPVSSDVAIAITQDADEAIVSVSDNGPGIPPEDLAGIFDRFYRVEKERSRSSGGSGLGLSICQAIARQHGATISVKSPPGEGATFTVRFPLENSAANVE